MYGSDADAASEDSYDKSRMVTSRADSDVTSARVTSTVSSDVITRRPSPDSRLASVECHLELKELWDKFHQLGTEMIITKSGRYIHQNSFASFVIRSVRSNERVKTLPVTA